jgi:hypothetical protein
MSAQNLHFTLRYARCQSWRGRLLASKYGARAALILGRSDFWRMCYRAEGRLCYFDLPDVSIFDPTE